MNSTRRRLADLASRELLHRAMEYRQMAVTAGGQSIASALDRLAIRYALLAARREIEETSWRSGRTDKECQDQSELAKLIASVNQAAAEEPNPVKALVHCIRIVAGGDADPYVVLGVLLEGAVYALATGIPRERQKGTAEAVLQLVADRLRANGIM